MHMQGLRKAYTGQEYGEASKVGSWFILLQEEMRYSESQVSNMPKDVFYKGKLDKAHQAETCGVEPLWIPTSITRCF